MEMKPYLIYLLFEVQSSPMRVDKLQCYGVLNFYTKMYLFITLSWLTILSKLVAKFYDELYDTFW